MLAREGVNPATALASCNSLLVPVKSNPDDSIWLAKRIADLWWSTTPTRTMTADAYLNETGRLLDHLPFDIVSHAIDAAARGNVKGFTPPAGEILAIAEPLLADRRRAQAALALVVGNAAQPAAAEPVDTGEEPITAAQIRAMTPQFRSMGLGAGFITQAQIDAALDVSTA